MNTKQKLQDLITKHKSNPNYDIIVNDLCRLYFEVEEQEKKESSFEDSQAKETTYISHQCLLDLNFKPQTSCIYHLDKNDKSLIYNTQTKEVAMYDNEEEQYITLPKLYYSLTKLKNLLKCTG